MNEILENIFEKKNDELIPIIKYYKEDVSKINYYIIQLLDYLKKNENSEIKTLILLNLRELIIKNFDIYLILTSSCIVNELNQNLFDILIELYLFENDNNELILEILNNINKNIEVNKKTINSIFKAISLNYQKKKCDIKQYQKYLNLLNIFYIESEKTIENYFIFNNSEANNYGIRIKNPIFSLKTIDIYKIQLICIFEKFHENDGTLLSYNFENSENRFSINYTNEGQLYYIKYLNLNNVDKSYILDIANQSILNSDKEKNKNQEENNEQKIFLHNKIPLNVKIIIKISITKISKNIYYLNLLINEQENKDKSIQEIIEIKDDLTEKNIKGVNLLQNFQGKLYSFSIINPQKSVQVKNISNKYIKDRLTKENLFYDIHSYFLPDFFDIITGKIIDPFYGIKAKVNYSYSKLNYNLVKYSHKCNLFQLGGLSIFLPLFEMMINIDNNYEIFKNFMKFISNIFEMIINNDKKEIDKYFLYYDEKFFPIFSLLLEQFTDLVLNEKIFFNFILVCNSLLTSYRESYSFQSFTQWLTFNYKFAIKFGENIQKEINNYMKQLFYSNNTFLLTKNIIYSFFHQLSRYSKPDKEFYFQDVLLYILNQENTDNSTKIYLMHLINEKNTKNHIIKTIFEAFIKHFKIELNYVHNKNILKDNQANENMIKSILKKIDLLKMLINVDILKDLRKLFIEKDDEIKVKIIRFIYIIFFSYTSLLEIKYINSKEPSINDYHKSKDKDIDLNNYNLSIQMDIKGKDNIENNKNQLIKMNDILNRSLFDRNNNKSNNTDNLNLHDDNNSIYNGLDDDEKINNTSSFINAIYNNLNDNTKENIIKNASCKNNIEINEKYSFDVLLNWFLELKEFENWQKMGIIITPLFIEDLFFDYCKSIKELKTFVTIFNTIKSNEKCFKKLLNNKKFILLFSQLYYENFKLGSEIESKILLGNENSKAEFDSLINDIFFIFFDKKYIFIHLKDIILNIIVFIIKDAENIHGKINEISALLVTIIKTIFAQFTGTKSKIQELYYCYYIILYYSLLFLDTNISNEFNDFEKIYLCTDFITIFDFILYKLIDNKEFQNSSHLIQNQKIDLFKKNEITDIIKEQLKINTDITTYYILLFYTNEKFNLYLINIITIFTQKLIKLIQKNNNYSKEIENFYFHLLRNYQNLIIILIFIVYKNNKDKNYNPILEEIIFYNLHEIFINNDDEDKNNKDEIKTIYKYFVINIINLLLALLYKNENEKNQKLIILKPLLKIYYEYEKNKTDSEFTFKNSNEDLNGPYIFYSSQNLSSSMLLHKIKKEINLSFNEDEKFKDFYNEKYLQENIITLFNKVSNMIKPSTKNFSIYKKKIKKKYSKLFDYNFNEKIISNYSRIEQDYYLNLLDNNKHYRKLKKRLFSWNNSYSNFEDFYIKRETKIKLKNKYYLTNNLTQPLLTPIIDLFSYTPNFMHIKRDKNFFLNEEYYTIPIKNYLNINPYFCPTYFIHGYDCCIIKLLYHIRGKIKIEDDYIEFYSVSLKEEKASLLINYEIEKKCCLGSLFNNSHKDTLYYLKISFNDIKYIFSRKYCILNNGIEIFTKNNKSYYIVFQDNNQLKEFNERIFYLKKKNLIYQKNSQMKFYNKELKTTFPKNSEEIKKLWNERTISNFEFLMWINIFGNRSYRDIYQYPIMPWIIEDLIIEKKLENEIDYISYLESNKSNIHFLRDLSIPLGMFENTLKGKKRKGQYIINFKSSIDDLNSSNYGLNITCKNPNYNFERLISKDYSSINYIEIPQYNIDFEKLQLNQNIPLNEIPYYFGSHYSNPAYVSHFLTRIYPFSFAALEIQGYNFDAPDRLFINIFKCYNSVITEKSDVREILPQFFYFPEMFININNFNFGYLQNALVDSESTSSIVLDFQGIFDPEERKKIKVQVPDVLLPYWSQNNPYKFISIHREILEENFIYVNRWVDLIFGEKQRGEKAQKIGNIFMAYSYEDVFINKKFNEDEMKINIKLIDYGICAHKIFNEKIEDRKIDNKIIIYFNKNRKKDDILTLPSYVKRGMIYNKNKDFLNTINPEKNNENVFNIVKSLFFKFYVAYHFGEKNEYLLVGGFFKEVILFYNLPNLKMKFIEIKKSNSIIKYKDNSLVTCIEVTQNNTLAFLGTELGNIIVYDINLNQNDIHKILSYKTIICHHTNRINYINSNLNLQLIIDCSADGFINSYTINNFELVNSVFIFPHEFFVDFVFLSSFPLNCFVIYSKQNQNFRTYSLNGKLIVNDENEIINNIKNDDEYIILKDNIEYFYDKEQNKNNKDVNKNISPYVFIDGDLKEYLIYNTKTGLKIRKLPFLEKIDIEQSKIIIE